MRCIERRTTSTGTHEHGNSRQSLPLSPAGTRGAADHDGAAFHFARNAEAVRFPGIADGRLPADDAAGGGTSEAVGGLLVLVGLFTRPVAFILSGQMAVAYFMAHGPKSFFPALNGGDAAILFCFIFLYLVFAGAGAFSVDERRA